MSPMRGGNAAEPGAEIDIDGIREAPWNRNQWSGNLVSVDNTSNEDFTRDDVLRVIAYGDTGHGWDGEACGIAELKDGRIIGWESDWGPTGSGFSYDAYGGEADILFGSHVNLILLHLSERAKELIAGQV